MNKCNVPKKKIIVLNITKFSQDTVIKRQTSSTSVTTSDNK